MTLQDTNRAPDILISLNRIHEAMLSDVFTGLPGAIETYDPTTMYCSVKPTLKRVYLNDDDSENIIEMPVISDVPVAFPQCAGGFLTFPLAKGDPVWLWVAQRSLDAWKETDGKTPIDPGDARRHHLTDVVAYPGVGTYRAPLVSADPTNVVLGVLGSALLMLGAKGLTAGNNGVARLTDLTTLADTFNAHIHPHPFGPTSPPTTTQSPTASAKVLAE